MPARVVREHVTRTALFALLLTAGLIAGGCRDGGGQAAMTRSEFEAGLMQREHLTQATASCVTGYLYGAFPDDQLRLLAGDGSQGVPPGVVGKYTQTLTACQYHDELGVPGPPPGQASP